MSNSGRCLLDPALHCRTHSQLLYREGSANPPHLVRKCLAARRPADVGTCRSRAAADCPRCACHVRLCVDDGGDRFGRWGVWSTRHGVSHCLSRHGFQLRGDKRRRDAGADWQDTRLVRIGRCDVYAFGSATYELDKSFRFRAADRSSGICTSIWRPLDPGRACRECQLFLRCVSQTRHADAPLAVGRSGNRRSLRIDRTPTGRAAQALAAYALGSQLDTDAHGGHAGSGCTLR